MPDQPKCIKCGRIKAVVKIGDRDWHCTHCNILFNIEPGEDSTARPDPSRRMEQQQQHGIGRWRKR